MDLDLRAAARLFNVSETTLARWVKEEGLSAFLINGQYRFNRVDLLEWANRRRLVTAAPVVAEGGAEPGSLAQLLERGGIHHRVPGSDLKSIMAAVAQLLPLSSSDRALAAQVLIERETLGSTSVGDGIAIPHPRSPLVFPVESPVGLLCFLEQPADFNAADGRPVDTLLILITPTVRLHLKLLSRVAGALHDAGFRGLLARKASRDEILSHLRSLP